MEEDTPRPENKELIILHLPQDEARRNEVYSELSKVLGKPPWACDIDGNKDSSSIECPRDDHMGTDLGAPQLPQSQSMVNPKGKQRDLRATRFHSANEMIAAAARETPAVFRTPQNTGSTDQTTFWEHRNVSVAGSSIYTVSDSTSRAASSVSLSQNPTESDDLLGFLAVVEHRKINILPLQWDNAPIIGRGGTANISKGVKVATTRGDNLGFVFKRTQSEANHLDSARVYRSVLSEVYILGHPVVQQHPNINSLKGICWETIRGKQWPVLIFKQAPYGDLGKFMKTKEARSFTFADKIKLCWEMGNALHLMHTCNAIHGDMKPENVLISKDLDGKYSAQVTDFGYSTIFANDNNEAGISLPQSWPWTAPEIKPGVLVTLDQAKAADIFSYGLLCFWLLCYDSAIKDPNDWTGPARELIQDIKGTEHFSETAAEIVKCGLDNTHEDFLQTWALDLFFTRVLLSSDQGKRELDVDTFPKYFGLQVKSQPLVQQFSGSSLLTSKASFTLPALLSRLARCPKGVRENVFQRLIEWASRNTDAEVSRSEYDTNSNSKAIASDIALCYELGLGTKKCAEKVNSWLQKGDRERFNSVLDMVRSDTNGFYTSYGYPPHLLSAEEVNGERKAIEKAIEISVPWINKILGQETNGYTPKVIDMNIISCKNQRDILNDIAIHHNKSDFFVSWMQLACSRDTSHHSFPLQDSHLVVFPTIGAEDLECQESLEGEQEKVLLSLGAKERVIGSAHEDTLQDLDRLRTLYSKTSQPTDRTVALWEGLLRLQRTMLGRHNPDTLKSTEGLARLYLQRNELRKARRLVHEVACVKLHLFGDKGEHALESLRLIESLNRAAAHAEESQPPDHLEQLAIALIHTSLTDAFSYRTSVEWTFEILITQTNYDIGLYAIGLCVKSTTALFGLRPQLHSKRVPSTLDSRAATLDPDANTNQNWWLKGRGTLCRLLDSRLNQLEKRIQIAEKDPRVNETEVLYAKQMLACGRILPCLDENYPQSLSSLCLQKAYQIQADLYMQGHDFRGLPTQNPYFILNPDMRKQGENLWSVTQDLLRNKYSKRRFLFHRLSEYTLGDPYSDDRTRLLPPVKRGPGDEYQPTIMVLDPDYSLGNSFITLIEQLRPGASDGGPHDSSMCTAACGYMALAYREKLIPPGRENIDQAIDSVEKLVWRANNDEVLLERIDCLTDLLRFRYQATQNIKDLQAVVLLMEQLTHSGASNEFPAQTSIDELWRGLRIGPLWVNLFLGRIKLTPHSGASNENDEFFTPETNIDMLRQLSDDLQVIWWQLKDDDTFHHLVKVQLRLITGEGVGGDPRVVLEAWLVLTTVYLRHLLKDVDGNILRITQFLDLGIWFLRFFIAEDTLHRLGDREPSKETNPEADMSLSRTQTLRRRDMSKFLPIILTLCAIYELLTTFVPDSANQFSEATADLPRDTVKGLRDTMNGLDLALGSISVALSYPDEGDLLVPFLKKIREDIAGLKNQVEHGTKFNLGTGISPHLLHFFKTYFPEPDSYENRVPYWCFWPTNRSRDYILEYA
ncbi:hypothetical protein TWF718_008331 [Orbilia javanica]|uniref:Protein kinase domain-containing protein n=1 Tax=Orbilia javanica TaxID=47235 RepID=A0AAN8NU18_9PEZI